MYQVIKVPLEIRTNSDPTVLEDWLNQQKELRLITIDGGNAIFSVIRYA